MKIRDDHYELWQYKSFIHHETVATTDTEITVKHYKKS